MRSRLLPCEVCDRPVSIRSRIKEGEHRGKKACPACKGSGLTSNRRGLRPITSKALAKNKSRSARRKPYFDYHMDKCTHSEESGVAIPNPGRVNICHLWPKGRFPSLEADLDNFVYLTWEEHNRFDAFLFSHDFGRVETEFPNSYREVFTRFAKLFPKCKERTKFYRAMEDYLIDNNYME